jgi:hypothetical protein
MIILKFKKAPLPGRVLVRLCGVTSGRNRANVGRFLLRRNIKIPTCFAFFCDAG